MSVKQRGKYWIVDVIWPDGKRDRHRMPSQDRANSIDQKIQDAVVDVEAVWQGLRARLGWAGQRKVNASFRDFAQLYIQRYATLQNRRVDVKQSRIRILCAFLANIPLQRLSQAKVTDFVAWRRGQGKKNATINRDLSVLRHMTRWATEEGYLYKDPLATFRQLREPRWEGQRPDWPIVSKVFRKLDPWIRCIFVFIYETGCRLQEALSLERWQLDLAGGTVLFPAVSTKSGKSRRVPLSVRARAAIATLPELEQTKLVFYHAETFTKWYTCRKPWQAARAAAGVPWLTVKDLRRALGIRLAESGVSMHFIQEVLGHSSVAITERYYAQFAPSSAHEAVLKVLNRRK